MKAGTKRLLALVSALALFFSMMSGMAIPAEATTPPDATQESVTAPVEEATEPSCEGSVAAPQEYTQEATPLESDSDVVAKVEVEDIFLDVNTYGYTDEDCYRYEWWNCLRYTVTFSDGSSAYSEGTMFSYNGMWYDVQYSDTQYAEHWQAGNTYMVTADFAGYQVSVPVTIGESPIAHVDCAPISIIDHGRGHLNDDGTFHYYWEEYLSYTITHTDGSTYSGTGVWLDYAYGDSESRVLHSDTQYEEPWTAGNTYTVTADFLGYQVSIPVTVQESPVESVSVNSLSIVENLSGYYDDEADYYHYLWPGFLSFTVTFKDGSTHTGTNGDLYYQDDYYSLVVLDHQAETHWELGNTYYPTVYFLGYETTVPVTIIECPVVNVEFEPLSLAENTCGQEEDTGFHYEWWNRLSHTVTFSDGSVSTGQGSFVEYQGNCYNISFDDTQDEEPWTVGNTYYPTVNIMGYDATASVTITSSPIVSIDFAPISITEYTKGSMDGDFFRYDWTNRLSTFTVTFSDGSTYTGEEEYLWYQGMDYWFLLSDNQYEEHWTVGNTYYPTVCVLGYEATVAVTIEPSFVVSAEIEPYAIVENTSGYESDGYYHYHWTDALSYTVTFQDGSSYQGIDSGVRYMDEHYPFVAVDNQEEVHWELGNTYYPTVYVMGYAVTVPVTVIESPVVNVEIAPVDVIANIDGWENGDHYHYDWWNRIRTTVTYADGSTYEGQGCWISYQGQDYLIEYSDIQYENPWTPGNTYYPTVSIMGYETSVAVSVVDSPIVSMEFDPISIYSNVGGYMEGDYYYYYWWNELSYTATFADGSTFEGHGDYLEYQGQGYWISSSDNQHEEHWTEGNTYYPTVSILGYETTVPVTLLGSPIVSIEFAPISIITGTNGYYMDEENFYYQWTNSLSFVAKFADGSTYTGQSSYLWYNGTDYRFSIFDNQYEEPWTAGSTYYPTVSVLGYDTTVEVTILQSPIASIDFHPISIMEGTNGYRDGETFQYYWSDRLSFTATFKDGSTYEGQGSYLIYQDSYYWFSTSYDQYANPFIPGNTYYPTVSVLGYKAAVELSITPSPVASVEAAPLYLDAYSNGYMSGNGFRYNWYGQLSYTITMTDGSVINVIGSSFYYQDEYYSISYEDTQYESPWQPDSTYEVNVNILGVQVCVPITISPVPIASITPDPISIIEFTDGHKEGDGFYYDWASNAMYTVVFTDGTQCVATGNEGLYYRGYYHTITTSDTQYETPWAAGNTYYPTASVMGLTVQVPVTIEESPVVSVEAEPVILAADGNLWYYRWYDNVIYTVTFNDGTQQTFCGLQISYKGREYYIDCTDSQYNGLPFQPGNTYECSITVLGVTAPVYVTLETPVSSDDFSYIVQDGMVFISGYNGSDSVLSIPDTVAGLPVAGVVGLSNHSITELVIGDHVTMLSANALSGSQSLKKLTLGCGITSFSAKFVENLSNLEEIHISPDNPNYTSVDGVVYDKDCTTLVVCPTGRRTSHTVPDSVTNIDVIFTTEAIAAGVSVIPGKNVQGDFYYEDGVFYSEDQTTVLLCDRNKTGAYVMPETVTTVNSYAFSHTSLTEVTLSSKVTEITYFSFSYSDALRKIVLPEGLERIGLSTFEGSTNLTDVNLPESLCSLGDYAFYRSGVQEITLPASLSDIGSSAFAYSNLERLEISDGVHFLGYSTFQGTRLQTVSIPDSVYSLGGYSFSWCEDLTSVTLGSGLGSIDPGAFAHSGLKSVVLPHNISYVDSDAFSYSKLTDVVFENDAIEIGYRAFSGCPLLEVNLGENVTQVSDFAFSGIAAERITLPESLTTISYRCFSDSKNLLYIDVSDSLQELDGRAFDNTAWLDSQDEGPVYLENYFYTYKGSIPSDGVLEIREGTTLMANFSLENQFQLETLKLPASLQKMGRNALNNCVNLQNIEIAEGNTVFTFEDGILYENGNSIWTRPVLQYVDYWGPEIIPFGTQLSPYWFYLSFSTSGWLLSDISLISGYDPYTSGVQILTVTMGGVSQQVQVTVGSAQINGLWISTLPDTLEYALGQPLRNDSMVVMAQTSAGTAFPVSGYEISGFDPYQPGEQTLTVSYMGYFASFAVTVLEDVFNFTVPENNVQVNVPTDAVVQDAQLRAEEILESDPEAEVLPELFQENPSVVYDIFFEKDGAAVQPTEEVTVSIPVPHGMDGNRCKVYHILDGTPQKLQAHFQDGFMVFTTNHFSYYGLVQVPGVNVSGSISGASESEVLVEILRGNKVIASTLTTDSYLLEDIPEGELTIRISQDGKPTRTFDILVEDTDLIKDLLFFLLGDMDGNELLDSNDAVYLLLHIMLPSRYPLEEGIITDIDKNDTVDSDDAVYLLLHTMIPERYPLED